MYQMIIVDDEPQIRKGLMNLIPWEEYGIEIVGEASDGIQALEILKKTKPQLAIIDIRMPKMDGLELLNAAKNLPARPKFIVLSGFDQFDYVRTSMRLGASNYLLKPVNPDELTATIQETIAALDDETSKKQQFDESMKALLNSTLNRLLHGRIEVRELREKCELLNITFRCNHMVVGIVRPLFDNSDNSLRYIMFKSLGLCKRVLNQALTAYPVADDADNVAIILKNEADQYTDKFLMSLLQQCSAQIQEELGVPCVTALGCQACSFSDLPTSYQVALRMLEIKTVWPEIDVSPSVITSVQQASSNCLDSEALANLLQQNEQAQALQFVHVFFSQISSHNQNADVTVLRYYTVELMSCIMQAARKCYITESELTRIKRSFYQRLQPTQSASSIEQYFCDMLELLFTKFLKIDNTRYSRKVQLAVQYIRQHYNDCNLSLKTLANQLDINSAYLGRQFSLETGAFFSDYLNNIRVQHAKQLLNTTSLKVSEIAERVGFANVPYFYTIYKKITGSRPGNTRQQDTPSQKF